MPTQVPLLFDADSPIALRLQANFSLLQKDIGDDRAWHNATLFWEGKGIKAKARTRGKSRRDPDNCDFPPLSLQLDSIDRQNTPFAPYATLRLVTHCQQTQALYEQIVLEEYAIYKHYSLLTEQSLRVRLAHIAYQDTTQDESAAPKLAFFVESSQDAAQRLGAKLVSKQDTIQYLACNSFLRSQMAIFQFMIGNTDWSVSNKHNIYLLQFANGDYVPIPYDFDYSGLIDAPYADVDDDLGIKTVVERVFRGYCQSEGELFLALDKFKAREQEFMRLWQSLPYHQTKRKQKVQAYLKQFYKILQNKDSVIQYFIAPCR